jgi:DHA1 family bicyclomycin/chloramphenicol resistance-like MFS transporter
MVLAGSLVGAAAIAFQSAALLAGWVTPLSLFLPGSLACFGQGLALPNAQVGAFRVMPNLGGTASGLGVFFQMMLGALFAQAYSLLADGTPLPMVLVVSTGGLLTLVAGIVAFFSSPSPRPA